MSKKDIQTNELDMEKVIVAVIKEDDSDKTGTIINPDISKLVEADKALSEAETLKISIGVLLDASAHLLQVLSGVEESKEDALNFYFKASGSTLESYFPVEEIDTNKIEALKEN